MTDQSSADVQREAERSRARISSTLDEIKERLTPGQILDDLMSGSGNGASAFMSNLGTSLRDHPIPALLIGAGVLMYLSGGEKRGADSATSGSDAGGGAIASAASSVTDALREGRETAKDAVSAAADRAGELKDRISSAVSAASDHLSDMRPDSSSLRMPHVLEDQPLVVGALGFALGALMGAALPMSETEDELMGGKSDALKESAAGLVKETMHEAGQAADRVAREIGDEADRQGLSGEAGSVVDKVSAVGERAVNALERELKPGAEAAAVNVRTGATGEPPRR